MHAYFRYKVKMNLMQKIFVRLGKKQLLTRIVNSKVQIQNNKIKAVIFYTILNLKIKN